MIKFSKQWFLIFLGGFILIILIFLSWLMQTTFLDPQPTKLMPTAEAVFLNPKESIEARVSDLLSHLTLEEKIGQMTLIEKDSLKNISDITNYHLGALLSGSGSKPKDNSAEGWRKMILEFQTEAKKSRLGIPLFYGVDAVHGHAHVPGTAVFPHAIGLGATRNPELVKAVANATAEQLVATGVNWNFAPNLDQPQDVRWGRVYETYSDDPALVAKLGVAYVEGLQSHSDNEKRSPRILATAKHYLGLGGMRWDTSLNKNYRIDQGVTLADEALLQSVYLPPFTEAIEAGALSIMVGLNTWGDNRMVRQEKLLTGILKQELGYKGFLVSDWYGVHEGRKNTFWATVQAVNAGVDMVMLPFDYKTFAQHMKWGNRLGLISDERIDDAVGRILYAKFAIGLFDQKKEGGDSLEISNPRHRELAREAVAQSLVLLKNEEGILPLAPDITQIRVAGSSAYNTGRQMGAWTIEWQGIDGHSPTEAVSILEGIKAKAGPSTKVDYNRLGVFSSEEKAPIGIAVVGEKPYAEGWGDTSHPILSEDDLSAIKNLQASCEKVIVVMVAGRPLLIKNELPTLDSLVMAWLPGSEGMGVADVLFGDKPFVGKLPLPWPSSSEQLPITTSGVTADGTPVLFPRYFGL